MASSAYQRAWQKANPEKVRQYKRRTRLKAYGLTPEQFVAMVTAQKGVCLICHEVPEQLVVDHDHVTGKVRGLLCHECNMALGKMKDHPARLRAAAEYLERSK